MPIKPFANIMLGFIEKLHLYCIFVVYLETI